MLKMMIEKDLRRLDIKEKFRIFSLEDAIQKGLERIVDDFAEYKKQRSLLNWDIRASLLGDEKTVALAFRSLVTSIDVDGITLEQILESLKWRDEEKLEQILDEFVSQNLLSTVVIDSITHYYAIKTG